MAGWPAGNGGSRANQALHGGKDKDEANDGCVRGPKTRQRPGDEGCVLCWRVMCGAADGNVRHEKESPTTQRPSMIGQPTPGN
jgi:hypothetical protein